MGKNLLNEEDNALLRALLEDQIDPMSRRVAGYIKAYEKEFFNIPDMDKKKAGFEIIINRVEKEKEQGRNEAQRKIEDAKQSYNIHKKSATEELLKQNQAKSLSTLMPDNELEALTNKAHNAKTWEERAAVNQHEALAAAEELQRRGKGVPLLSRQALAQINYGEPWLNTEKGEAGIKELWINNAPRRNIRFPSEYGSDGENNGYELSAFLSDGKGVQ